MQAVSQRNQLTYKGCCQLGGCLNSDLVSVERFNGSHRYTTYHHIGYGTPYWKQDKPKGPA